MTIDARYCPPIMEAICDDCGRYSTECQRRWVGVTLRHICRRCRTAVTP